MDLLLKILKVSALLLFIFVLVVLCAPTMKGPFVIIHFATTLKAWLLIQMAFLGLALAAHLLSSRIAAARATAPLQTPYFSKLTLATELLRC